MSSSNIEDVDRYLFGLVDDPRPSEIMKLREIANTLNVMLDGSKAIFAWLSDSQPDFQGLTPEEMVAQGNIDEVLYLVRAWAAGSFR
jgi:hypothetical protein